MVTDFGAHLYPESVFPEPMAESPIADLLGPLLTDPTELLDRYDAAGIDRAVLSQPFYMGLSETERVREANRALREVVGSEERLHGLAAIPTAAGGEAAAAEFERALDAGYNGGAVETETEGVELVDPALEPVFEVADRTGAPLLVHPKLDESLHPDALDDDYLLNAIFGREAALAASISKVVHEGVLDRYPNLNLVYHHLGGNFAAMLGRVHLQLDAGRWPGQDGLKPYPEFRTQVENRIVVDTSGFFGHDGPVRSALETLPPSNVVFGTDYPFEPRDADELRRQVDAVRRVQSETTATQVLETTVQELLVNV